MNGKARVWLAGGIAFAMAVFAVGYFIVVKPKKDDVAAKQAETTSLQAENNRLQQQITQLLQQSKQITAKQIELARVANRIPADPALPSLVRRLSSDAKNSDVNLVSITPVAPTPATPYVASAAPYQQIGLTLEVHGTYASLREWFAHLEDSDKRLIVVEDVHMAPTKGATAGSSGSATGASTLTIGTDGIPEGNNYVTATIKARTFNTTAATVTADLPALQGATGSGTTGSTN